MDRDAGLTQIIAQLESDVRERFVSENSGHDIYHLRRVMNLALALQEKEGGDRLVIGVAAFLHDVHRIIGQEAGKFCSPADSLPVIRPMLDRTPLTDDQKERILHCVEFHDEYGLSISKDGRTATDLETLIIQDADNLDGIGAIGIGRTFTFGGAHDLPMWIPDKPFDRVTFDESTLDPSTVHHFYSKLLRFKDDMNTATAKEMAAERHRFMELFLQEFFDEWQGKK